MKTKTLQTLGLAFIAVVGFTACNGLGKMVKKAGTVTYTVTPSPLEEHGDTIVVTISGKYPAKYFGKKVNLTVAPMLKYNGGEKALKTVTLCGEKVKEPKGQVVKYSTGGSFSYTDKTAYIPELKNCDLVVKAQGAVKSKTKDIPEAKIAEGTIITPLLTKADEMALIGKDDLKDMPDNKNANIFFLVNTSNIRPTEIKGDEMKGMQEYIIAGKTKPRYEVQDMSISAYASPDGEQALNGNLAENRAKASSQYYKGLFKDKKTKFDAGTKDEFYKTVTTAEDWDGFKRAMEASSVPDKDLVLRVLTMYTDLDQREKEIKNMSKTYTEISDVILPKLRRSVLTLNGIQHRRTDDELKALCLTAPDSLNVEELLYSATLYSDWNQKLTIYKSAQKQFGSDWRTSNNVGYCYLMLNKVNDAAAELDKADKASANNPIVQNNLGIVARWKGDRKAAMELYKKATSAGAEVSYNMGICEILNGNYTAAVGNFGSYKTFNSALAMLLNGNADGAASTLDASKEKDDALSYYLRSIIGARTGKTDMMISNLKIAIQKDGSYKEHAKTDLEYFKYRSNADYKALTD